MASLFRATGGTTSLLPTTSWTAPNGMFTTVARNDASAYSFASTTSTVTLPSSSLANGYLLVGRYEFNDSSNGRHNPQGQFVQSSGTGSFVTGVAGGYNRDASEDRSYVHTWGFVDNPSASATFQFQWKRDTDTPTGGTVRASLEVIPLYYSDVGLYTSTSTALYGGTTPNQVTGFSGTDGSNITLSSNVVSLTGDNKRYLVLGSQFFEGRVGRTQRWHGLRIDGVKEDAAKAYSYYRQASDDESGDMFTWLIETATSTVTVDQFCYRGDGVGNGQGGADVDGSTPSVGDHALVVLELNDSAEVFRSKNNTDSGDLTNSPTDITINEVTDFNDTESFTDVANTSINCVKDNDYLFGGNISAASNNVANTQRWTAYSEFHVNGTEDTTIFAGDYLRNDQSTTSTFGWSANLMGFIALSAGDDVGVSVTELSGTEGGGDAITPAGWSGFWGLNLDTLEDTATDYDISCDAGSISVSGQDATLTAGTPSSNSATLDSQAQGGQTLDLTSLGGEDYLTFNGTSEIRKTGGGSKISLTMFEGAVETAFEGTDGGIPSRITTTDATPSNITSSGNMPYIDNGATMSAVAEVDVESGSQDFYFLMDYYLTVGSHQPIEITVEDAASNVLLSTTLNAIAENSYVDVYAQFTLTSSAAETWTITIATPAGHTGGTAWLEPIALWLGSAAGGTNFDLNAETGAAVVTGFDATIGEEVVVNAITATDQENNKIFQRSGSTRNIVFSGTNTGETPDNVQVQLYESDGTTVAQAWAELTSATITSTTFTGTLSVPEGGMYRFAVRSRNSSNTVLATSTTTTNLWGVGDNLLFTGDSDVFRMYSSESASGLTANTNVRRFDYTTETWVAGGSDGIAVTIANTHSTNESVPVGIVEGAKDGGLAEQFGTSGTTDYNKLDSITSEVGECAWAIANHGANDCFGGTLVLATVKTWLTGIETLLRTNCGASLPIYYLVTSRYDPADGGTGSLDGNFTTAKQAQKEVAAANANSHYVISAMDAAMSSFHYTSAAYQNDIEPRVSRAIEFELGSATYFRGPQITALNVSGTTGTATVVNNGTSLTIDTNNGLSATDDNGALSISSVTSPDANTLTITFGATPVGTVELSYGLGEAPHAAGEGINDNTAETLPLEPLFSLEATTATEIDASSGSFLLTGDDAGLTIDFALNAEPSSVSLAGVDNGSSIDVAINAEPISLSLTGVDAGLTSDVSLNAETGSLIFTGVDLTTTLDIDLNAETTAIDVTGIDATLGSVPVFNIDAEVGSISVAGVNNNATIDYSINLEPSSFVVNGIDVLVSRDLSLSADSGSFNVADFDLATTRDFELVAEVETISINGIEATLGSLPVFNINAETGSLIVDSVANNTTIDYSLNAESSSFSIAGFSATLGSTASLELNAEAGSVSISDVDASLTKDFSLNAESENINVIAPDATLGENVVFNLNAENGAIAVTGVNNKTEYSLNLNAQASSVVVSSFNIQTGAVFSLNAQTGLISVDGVDVVITKDFALNAVTGQIEINDIDAFLSRNSLIPNASKRAFKLIQAQGRNNSVMQARVNNGEIRKRINKQWL